MKNLNPLYEVKKLFQLTQNAKGKLIPARIGSVSNKGAKKLLKNTGKAKGVNGTWFTPEAADARNEAIKNPIKKFRW